MKKIIIILILVAFVLPSCRMIQEVRYPGGKSYIGKGNNWTKQPYRRDIKNVRLN